jgi:GNAT superfamily N-acetyltransferase
MTATKIRPALAAEHELLEALQMRASLANPDDREALLAHPEVVQIAMERISSGQVFIIECDDQILGFATMQPRADGQADLNALFVDPCHRREGAGRSLVDHCASVARSAGASALHVVGNKHAEKFYSSCGFESLGTIGTQFGEGLDLRKPL